MPLALLSLLRPKQWTKNLLVFAAPLFTGQIHLQALLPCVWAFVAMACASSATYVLNDIGDRDRDRLHPKKSQRAIASGLVPPGVAVGLALLLAVAALAIGWWIRPAAFWCIVAYFALQAAYNLALKATPVADVFAIALGFVLRAVLGAAAIQVPISGWLLFCTMALALMLGFSKRRAELMRLGEEAADSRESLSKTSRGLLDLMVGLSAGMAMLSYGVYSLESETAKAHPALMATTLFVWYGISRYLYLVFDGNQGEEPETILLTDAHILLSVVGFVVVAILVVRNVLTVNLLGI